MKEVMLQEMPVEERENVLRDTCYSVVEKMGYLHRYTPQETNEKRKELADVSITLRDLEDELSSIRESYKARMKPIQEEINAIIAKLKQGGDYVSGDCYKFIDESEGMVGIYSPEGYLVENRPILPEERQMSIFRNLGQTGTDDE